MTDVDIRERCQDFLNANMDGAGRIVSPQELSVRLESLCREMIAEGLEMAATRGDRAHTRADERSSYAQAFRDWCRRDSKRARGV
jgi:hypothetical protein